MFVALTENEGLNNDVNWQDAYWNRESNPIYIELCKNYECGKFVYDKHPKNVSLREFMKNFTKKWKYAPKDNVFPHFIPCYRYIQHKGRGREERYEEYCKSLLLQDKPGCTIENVGKAPFESCESELLDFVEKSEFCPQYLKAEVIESQIPKDGHGDKDGDKHEHFGGEALNELYI